MFTSRKTTIARVPAGTPDRSTAAAPAVAVVPGPDAADSPSVTLKTASRPAVNGATSGWPASSSTATSKASRIEAGSVESKASWLYRNDSGVALAGTVNERAKVVRNESPSDRVTRPSASVAPPRLPAVPPDSPTVQPARPSRNARDTSVKARSTTGESWPLSSRARTRTVCAPRAEPSRSSSSSVRGGLPGSNPAARRRSAAERNAALFQCSATAAGVLTSAYRWSRYEHDDQYAGRYVSAVIPWAAASASSRWTAPSDAYCATWLSHSPATSGGTPPAIATSVFWSTLLIVRYRTKIFLSRPTVAL